MLLLRGQQGEEGVPGEGEDEESGRCGGRGGGWRRGEEGGQSPGLGVGEEDQQDWGQEQGEGRHSDKTISVDSTRF